MIPEADASHLLFTAHRLYAHIQERHLHPHFELEPTDHPLSQEYHKGIAPERVREIMMERLRAFC